MKRITAFWFVIVMLGACSEDRSVLEQRAESPETKRLVGTWDANFRLERPLLIGSEPSQREISGEVAFVANRTLVRAYPTMELPSDAGSFDVDFSPFGFDLRSDSQTPTALAAWHASDSVDIILGEPRGDVSVRMHGRIVGDSIVGGWRVLISRTGGGGGSFVLVRHKPAA
jgi:hypothetical protein